MKFLWFFALSFTCSLSLASQSPTSTEKVLTPDYNISDCPDLITLSGPIVKDLYQAKDIHLTDVVVFPIIELNLISETQVDLNSEIEVPSGSTLTIQINDCPADADDVPGYRPGETIKDQKTNH